MAGQQGGDDKAAGSKSNRNAGAAAYKTAEEIAAEKAVPQLAHLISRDLKDEVEKALAAYWSEQRFPGTIREHVEQRRAAAHARESKRFLKDWRDKVGAHRWAEADSERFQSALAALMFTDQAERNAADGVEALSWMSRALYFLGKLHGPGAGQPRTAAATEKKLSPRDHARALGSRPKARYADQKAHALKWWEEHRHAQSKTRKGFYISHREAGRALSGEDKELAEYHGIVNPLGLSARTITDYLDEVASPSLKDRYTE